MYYYVDNFLNVGKISSKRHEFYEDAFNALWRKHDARKGYQRERYTGLEKTKFLKLLCAFSAVTYIKQAFDIQESDMSNYIEAAVRITNIRVLEENFIKDLYGFNKPHDSRRNLFQILTSFVPGVFLGPILFRNGGQDNSANYSTNSCTI